MPRAKKKTLPTEAHQPDTSFNPSEFDKPAEIVQSVADGMAMPPDTQREAAHEDGHSHAERVTRRESVITPSGLTYHKTDVLAGIKQGEGFRLIDVTNQQGEQVQVKVRDAVLQFQEKPSPEVTTVLKDAGFRWRAEDRLWTRPIKRDTAWQDRAHADATFEAVSKQTRTERGITHSVGMPG